MRRLQTAGDSSHMENKHICDLCRCRRVAGFGTKGKFWGEEEKWEEVGHYGVGYCYSHEIVLGKKRGWEYARKHMKAVQQYSKAQTNGELYKQFSNLEAREAEERIEVRDSISQLKTYLDEFCVKFKDEKETLTEAAGGKTIGMTDKTKALVLTKLALAVGQLAKDRFTLESSDYVTVDSIRIRIPQIVNTTFRLMDKLNEKLAKGDKDALEEVKRAWTDDFRRIFSSLKPGRK